MPRAAPETLVFRAALSAKLYREIEVAGSCTLDTLAQAVVVSFGFDFDHAFGFYNGLKNPLRTSSVRYELFADIGEAEPGTPGVKRTRATRAFPEAGAKMLLLFDYGDNWEFIVTLVGRNPKDPRLRLPRVLKSVGEAPEQYPADPDEPEQD